MWLHYEYGLYYKFYIYDDIKDLENFIEDYITEFNNIKQETIDRINYLKEDCNIREKYNQKTNEICKELDNNELKLLHLSTLEDLFNNNLKYFGIYIEEE